MSQGQCEVREDICTEQGIKEDICSELGVDEMDVVD